MAKIWVATDGWEFSIFVDAPDAAKLGETCFFDGVTEYQLAGDEVGEGGRFILLAKDGEAKIVPWDDTLWARQDEEGLAGWSQTATGCEEENIERGLWAKEHVAELLADHAQATKEES